MKISQTIKEKRKELGMTQEQVADFLGVSIPSVSKWENGNTYPDITLLPPLARLLGTDLNTLLSFKDDLSDIEIGHIVNEISAQMESDGFDAGFRAAVAKIREYPNCDMLAYCLAACMKGALSLLNVTDHEPYIEYIDELIERSAKSSNSVVRNSALSLQIARLIELGEFEHAEELIKALPTASPDGKTMLANLYLKMNRYDEAAMIYEQKLLELSINIQATLLGLTRAAACEDRLDDAEYCADVYERTVREFGFVDYTAPAARLEVATKKQDSEGCLAILKEMLESMSKEQVRTHLPLYRKLELSSTKAESLSFERYIPAIIKEFETDEKLSFLRAEPRFLALMAEYSQA